MGIYNELMVESAEFGEFSIQFKFGELWLHKYKIGDAIKFTESQNKFKLGVNYVPGIAEILGKFTFFRITVETGRIIEFEEISETQFDDLDRISDILDLSLL